MKYDISELVKVELDPTLPQNVAVCRQPYPRPDIWLFLQEGCEEGHEEDPEKEPS